MDPDKLRELLEMVRSGRMDLQDAMAALGRLPFEDLGIARIDHHRHLRLGMPEVVFGESKTPDQITAIAERILEHHGRVMVTRVDADKAQKVQSQVPRLKYESMARILLASSESDEPSHLERVAVVAAGTSDLPVAEEAAVTLSFARIPCDRIYDVGVAGIHRLFEALPRLSNAPAIIVVAGMEGALPSVVGGLVAAPIVAVPTSIGYGAALSGFTALFGMLTSCASGITVVNIDNGFGAGMAVLRLMRPRLGSIATRPSQP